MKRGSKKTRIGAALGIAFVLAGSPVCSVVAFGEPEAGEVTRVWDFEEGDQGWVYDDSWSGDSFKGGGSCEYDRDKGLPQLHRSFVSPLL